MDGPCVVVERIKLGISPSARRSVMKASGGNGTTEHVIKTTGETGWEGWG